ncbi:MAG: hypothetical protein E6G84_03175 [Alphaproteobacteria bacterium]|nr:MAG: hypothetical protein E6G84_03175 [Alphaproteobacteria bacterium]
MGPLVAASKTMVLAGTAMALSGLTVTASMFIVRKWLWRYLGVHAAERLRRFGSLGLILGVAGAAAAAWTVDAALIEQQVPELWLRIGIAAAAALLCAVAVRAIADVIWGRDSKWGRRTRLAGSAIAAVGLASVLLVQGAAMFHLQEKISSIPRLKEIGSIQRIVQSFRRD